VTCADLSALAQELAAHRGRDAWWSPHVWTGNHRRAASWAGADVVALDIDHADEHAEHAVPSSALADALRLAIEQHELPRSAWHATPRGARIILALGERATDAARYSRAVHGAAALVDRRLGELGLAPGKGSAGFHTDHSALDLARMFFTPNAFVDGVARAAEVRSA
jgi:hypothetical protein